MLHYVVRRLYVNRVVYVVVRKVREEVRRVYGEVRRPYMKWSGRSVPCIRWSGGLCVVYRVVYVLVRKVREEVRRVHKVVRKVVKREDVVVWKVHDVVGTEE